MLNKTRVLGICLMTSGLTACMTDNPTTYTTYTTYQPYAYNNTQFSSEGYENTLYATDAPPSQQEVVTPDTHYASDFHSPTPHKDMDKEWVNHQNSQGYTIELADGEKASQVAGALYKAPKNDRTAEINYQRDGKTYYKGLYGTYPNYEAAQKAFNALPADVKQNAGIKTWANVQHGVGE